MKLYSYYDGKNTVFRNKYELYYHFFLGGGGDGGRGSDKSPRLSAMICHRF